MTDKPKSATRRTILIGAATLSGLPLLAAAGSAQAAGTMPQTNAKYQLMPKGAQACSNCTYYIPGASAAANGQCKIVAGVISPHGYCVLFAPKAH
jgi:hypothetical protein